MTCTGKLEVSSYSVSRVDISKELEQVYLTNKLSLIAKRPWTRNGVKKTGGGPGNELRRWHGTSLKCNFSGNEPCSDATCAVCSISKTGFKMQFANNGSFGKGMYFSAKSSKSHGYNGGSQDKIKAGTRGMFLCLVLAGDGHPVSKSEQFVTPPNDKDCVFFTGTNDELIIYREGYAIPRFYVVYTP